MFATRLFRKGETIEICPTLAKSAEEWGEATSDYVFGGITNTKNTVLVWGLGSLYNHSDNPSAEHELSENDSIMTYIAKRDIKAEEEITVNYGEHWWTHRLYSKIEA